MFQLRSYLNRRLRSRQAALVVFIVAGLAGIAYLGFEFIAAMVLESRVNAALPKVCADIRSERGSLLNAIEAYKSHFGFYPPDHVVSRQPLTVDAEKNPLFYELAGVVYNPHKKVFEVHGQESADAKYVKEFFQCDGFTNCVEMGQEAKRFLTLDRLPTQQLHDDPDVFALGFEGLYHEGLAAEVMWELDISSWRYVSSSPTNNSGKFDLWIDIKTKNWSLRIGNWPGAE